MITKILLFLSILVSYSLAAQKIVFPDVAFKSKLLTSNASSTVARNLSDDYFAIDSNNNGEIEILEAAQVKHLEVDNASISSLVGIENFINLTTLQCSNNLISNLNVSLLTKLTDLNCGSNSLSVLNIAGATNLENLFCQSNVLETIDASNLIYLKTVECVDNKLKSLLLTGLINLESLNCSGNLLATINLQDLSSLVNLECNNNLLQVLDLKAASNIEVIQCNYNQLNTLDLTPALSLKSVECTNNKLTILNTEGLNQLVAINCNNNLLKTFTVNTLFSLNFLYCKNNLLESLTVAGLSKLKVLDFSKNKLKTIDLLGLTNLVSLFCSNNMLFELDVTNQIAFQSLDAANNLLTNLYLKNGSNESTGFLIIAGNPNLKYICADESEIEFVKGEVSNYGYTNCEVNSYCSFVPAGFYNIVNGSSKVDSNQNGCDILDNNFPEIKLLITDVIAGTSETIFADKAGLHTASIKDGSYLITPFVENARYNKISPASTVVNFPAASNQFTLDYCVSPNGSFNDLEIILIPLDIPTINVETKYKIIYKNKGTITRNGTLNLSFGVDALKFVSAQPAILSQESSVLTWSFTNFLPQETRTIVATFKVNSTIKTGYKLDFKSTIDAVNDIESNGNIFNLSQIVSNVIESNTKICLEGNTISSSKAGDYLHYIIRFQNSGSDIARNIVISDVIDSSKFDIKTLIPLTSSHDFATNIKNNTAEFIFENIYLPLETGKNQGYIAFKVKTLNTLRNQAVITNTASIYFDFNRPIITKAAVTTINNLTIEKNLFSNSLIIFPNPVGDVLYIKQNLPLEIKSFAIYNFSGQLLQSNMLSNANQKTIDVSNLVQGNYFLIVNTKSQRFSTKFIKQ